MNNHHHQHPQAEGINNFMFNNLHTSAALSRFAESDAFGFPNGRISFSRPRHTGDFNDGSRDCIQFKLPCTNLWQFHKSIKSIIV